MNKKYNITDEEYIEAAKKSKSIAEMCKLLGRNPCGAGYYIMKKKIEELKIDTSHFCGQGWNKGGLFDPTENIKKPIEEILVENSSYSNISSLKRRLLNTNLKEYVCERCGNVEWGGEKIPLELHHINGNNRDHRLENLQLLCPNCHALTDNYCSKNKKK